jgi:hypothetical protein
MDPNQQKEQFSNAFLHAIAAVSECSISKPSVDDDSVDWTVSKVMPRRPKIDLQLKCTTPIHGVDGETISYSLKKKNYDDLRLMEVLCPRILVVVFAPPDIVDWLDCTNESLTLRKCAYWLSLSGYAESDNETSVTVHLPTSQRFNVDALNNMMNTISNGGQL